MGNPDTEESLERALAAGQISLEDYNQRIWALHDAQRAGLFDDVTLQTAFFTIFGGIL
jgi:hypothetical protein